MESRGRAADENECSFCQPVDGKNRATVVRAAVSGKCEKRRNGQQSGSGRATCQDDAEVTPHPN